MRIGLLVLMLAWVAAGCGAEAIEDDLGTDPGVLADVPDAGPGDLGADGTTEDAIPDGAAGDNPPGDNPPGDNPPGDEAPGDASPDVPKTLPDAAFFHADREPAVRFTDSPYPEDFTTLYRTPDRLPDLDVRALVASTGGRVWAGTASGLFAYDGSTDAFVRAPLPGGDGAVVDLFLQADGTLWVALADRLLSLPDGGGGDSFPSGIPPTAVAADADTLWVGTAEGLWSLDRRATEAKPVLVAIDAVGKVAVRDLLVTGTGAIIDLWVATDHGVLRVNGAQVSGTVDAASGILVDDDVRALAWDDQANLLWAATARGVASWSGFTGKGDRKVAAGKGALPTDALTALGVAKDLVLLGHERGATATQDFSRYDHYVSQRWLPDDRVTGAAAGSDGSRWVATRAGVARIRLRDATMRAKAEALFDQMMQRYWRLDFIGSGAYSDDPWNPTAWALGDFDNDGLWTQMGIGALCYAYAVTRDEKYYQAANRAMRMMFLEIDIPAQDFEKAGLGRGFITRSLVRDDEVALFQQKAADPEKRWHLVTYTDGHQYYWKDDTSSDELAGHFFGFPLYYDLCAKDDAERAQVAEHAGAVARYIVKGGYVLRDVDGEATTFGHWEPDKVAIAVDGLEACVDNGHDPADCIGAKYGAGWLNGTEILGLLLSAWHMTGDPDLYRAYDELVTTHRYAEAIAFNDEIQTVVSPSIANHSDHELAMLAYHTLVRYEPDAGRRQQWIDSLKGFYAWESGGKPGAGNERQPLWTAFMSLADSAAAKAADGVRSLREYPSDLREWHVDNTHRKDAGNWPKDRFDEAQFDTVFPYDEIRTMWWNGNPYTKVEGGDGRAWQGPVAYLLAYWASAYAGIVQ